MARSRGHADASPPAEGARLAARPGAPTGGLAPGLHRLHLAGERDALLSIPAGYRADRPAPFVLSLHGAGGNEQGGLYPLHELADDAGLILLSPASRGRTWDVILGNYGPDVAFVDAALSLAFNHCSVDPEWIAVAGFSDGASYALSLGVSNGDLFPQILAFSPGFMAPSSTHGRPRVFVSHGIDDRVLSIDRTSRRVVPQLKQAGYDVTYREFDGPHTVPAEVAAEAIDWMLRR